MLPVLDSDSTNIDYPEAYQKGYILFCDLEILVNENVLIPRIETEKIVELVENYINENSKRLSNEINILDIGTGSGCIAIALAKIIKHAKITAIDISEKALEVAKTNAKKHNVENKIEFVQNDLLSEYNKKHDIIVSNLPYIPTDYIQNLNDSVKKFEPILALDGGKEGFELYRKLFKQIIYNDINPKFIIIEFDDTHSEIALIEGKKYFPNHHVSIKKDKYGYDRFLSISVK